MDDSDYLTREEVVARLQIKPATLYAYVSRGQLRRIKDQRARRSMYLREDVERLATRHPGQQARAEVAARALRWGDPIVGTNISHIEASGPCYRSRKASDLARSGVSFEAVVHLLLTGVWQPAVEAWPDIATPPDLLPMLAADMKNIDPDEISTSLAKAVLSLGMRGRGAQELAGDGEASGRLIIQTLSGCVGYLSPARRFVARRPGESISHQFLRACGRPLTDQARSAINQALIILADHELATASFVSRVAASTNSDLFCCVAASLCAHSGASSLAATFLVDSQLFEPLSKRNWAALQKLARDRGATLFGFNHPLYPKGDPRADQLLEICAGLKPVDAKVPTLLRFLDEARAESVVLPGIAVALAVFARTLGLPPGAAAALWIVSRSAGWIAHALEQRMQGFMLRPRAHPVPTPEPG